VPTGRRNRHNSVNMCVISMPCHMRCRIRRRAPFCVQLTVQLHDPWLTSKLRKRQMKRTQKKAQQQPCRSSHRLGNRARAQLLTVSTTWRVCRLSNTSTQTRAQLRAYDATPYHGFLQVYILCTQFVHAAAVPALLQAVGPCHHTSASWSSQSSARHAVHK
jgi:hypothetical protein